MNVDTFWGLIEASRQISTDCEEQARALARLLAEQTPAEIIAFDEQLHDRLFESFRSDLLAVATIYHGGCSNDSFEYFRGWLIAQGREYFELAIAQPERAADRARVRQSLQCEEILYVAYEAYEQRTGEQFPMPAVPRADTLTGEPAGQRWEEQDLPRLYPELWQRFGR